MSFKKVNELLDTLRLHGMQLYLSAIPSNHINIELYNQLVGLLEKEQEYRKSRSLNYRIKLAQFPQIKLLADTKAANLVEALDIAQVINNRENIFFIGGSGSAKTHLAIALAYNALEIGKKVKFYKLSQLARDLMLSAQNNNECKFISNLQRLDLLIIDELGYVPIDKRASVLLFEIFSNLYEHTSVFVTTHLKFDEWNDMFGDLKATKAIIDRLTHHCHIIETGNITYRMKGGQTVN